MKYILQQLVGVVLLLNINTVFSQTNTLETETAFMNCIYQSLSDKGVKFKTILQKAEQKLIDKKLLKDGKGESYVALYKNLENAIDEGLEDLGVSKYIEQVATNIIDTTSVACMKNVYTSLNYGNSKFSKMVALSQFPNEDISDFSSTINSILAILKAEDFEHDYYKMTTFVMIETINYVDLDGVVTKLPEIEEEKISDEERVRAFKIEIQSEEIILINGKKSDFATIKKQLKRYLKNTTSESIIILKNDRSTPYMLFIKTQNEMVGAFEEVRNELATQKFKRSFDELTQEQQEEIKKIYPIKIVDYE